MKNLLDNPEKLFSSLNLFINDKFKEALLLIEKDLKFNRIRLDIKSKKGILSEDQIHNSLKEFFESEGLVIELVRPEIPDWKVYNLFKNGDLLGCFNSDLLSKDDHDRVLITVSPNS